MWCNRGNVSGKLDNDGCCNKDFFKQGDGFEDLACSTQRLVQVLQGEKSTPHQESENSDLHPSRCHRRIRGQRFHQSADSVEEEVTNFLGEVWD